MKRISYLLFVCLLISTHAIAQGWASKAAKSVFTLKTFGADGILIGSANGFFVSEDGDAVSIYAPFAGAVRAVVIDASGKELPVECMLGANELYDVAKFRVNGKKTQPLTIAGSQAQAGQQVWMLPYSVKKAEAVAGQMDKAETFQDSYAYYTVKMQMAENAVGCPLLNESGEVIGLMQPSANTNTSANTQQFAYAISARYANDMKITGLSLYDASLQKTNIKIAMPDNKDDATLMMYLAGSTRDSLYYVRVIDDFIAKFPKDEEGYINRAQLAVNGNDIAAAARDMQQAISVSNPKDNAHYAYSRMIYSYCLQHAEGGYQDWNLDKAAEEAKAAYDISPLSAYKHQLGQILFAQKKYDEALGIFNELATSDIQGAEVYYEAARCHEMKGDTTQMLALLDSAVNVFSKPYLKEAAPYIWARALARMSTGKNRLAVQDMNEYERLVPTGLNAQFYYIREQAELGGRQFQQALNDITKATQLAPDDPDYFGEKASLENRVGMYDEAAASARECIRLAPTNSDGYLLLGVALCQKGDKTNGLLQLQKAKELGNNQADALIERYK